MIIKNNLCIIHAKGYSERIPLKNIKGIGGKPLLAYTINCAIKTNFNTYGTCDKNLILLNFVQSYTLPSSWVYIPVIYR